VTGHRSEHGRPRRRDATPENQRAHTERRLNAARTPREQLSIAFDFLRMRMEQATPNGEEWAAKQGVSYLLELAGKIPQRRDER